MDRRIDMNEDLKDVIRNYLRENGYDLSKAEDLIDEYESAQTFTELENGDFEMVTGNTRSEVEEWIKHRRGD